MSAITLSKLQNNHVYVAKSNVASGADKYGLFAKHDIKKDSLIVEFKGRHMAQSDVPNNQSEASINFNDGTCLVLHKNDLASFCKDCIMFPTHRRKLMKALKSSKPFYKIAPHTTHNARLILSERARSCVEQRNKKYTNRAFLKASCDIAKDQEICTHYGISYYFYKECNTIGFIQEGSIAKNGFPESLHTFPAMKSYFKLFYPDVVRIEVTDEDATHIYVSVIEKDDAGLLNIPFPKLNKIMVSMNTKDLMTD